MKTCQLSDFPALKLSNSRTSHLSTLQLPNFPQLPLTSTATSAII
ncbi:hypothetical protein [Limnospira fusiformis]